MSEARAWRVVVALLALGTGRSALAQEKSLFEADVVKLAAENNPELKAALLQLESATWDVRGLADKYAAVLEVDGSATQTKNPNLGMRTSLSQTGGTSTQGDITAVTVVNTNTIQRLDAGAQISKHTLWGTDLTLRLGNYLYQTSFSQSSAGALKGTFGPGYGVSAKLTLKQPLLRGRGRAVNEAELLASRVSRDTAQYTRDRVASEVLRDALSAYWELWYAGMAASIEVQALEVAEKQRDDAAARVQTGTLAPADLLAFETEVATQQENLLNAQLSQSQRQLELLEKLGIIGEESLEAVKAESEPVASVPPRAEAVRRALAEAAELKELMSAVQLAALQQKTAADPQRARLDLDSYVQASAVARVAPSSGYSVLAVYANKNWNTTITGTTNEYFEIRNIKIASGRVFSDLESLGANPVCVIGHTVQQKLFGHQDPLGASIRLGRTSCLIIGTTVAKGQSTFGMDQDDFIIMPLTAFQRRIAGNRDVGAISVSARDEAQTRKAKQQVELLMRERRRIAPGQADNFSVRDTREILQTLQNVTGVLTALLGAVAAVSLLVGGIGIMNIMLVSVTERTREIGIRLAVGARAHEVLLQFLVEAVVLCLFGGVLGMLLGLGGAFAAGKALQLPFVLRPEVVLIAFGFSGCVGLAFGFFPARKAASLNPIEALRHE